MALSPWLILSPSITLSAFKLKQWLELSCKQQSMEIIYNIKEMDLIGIQI